MSPTIEEQIESIKHIIAEMESQRGSLGDEFVDSSLLTYQRKLDELTALLASREMQPPAEPAQQRKLVTLLFMDIAGSSTIAQQMDPEDVREVFDSALKKLAVPIEAHGGKVTRFMGDGFLSVYGTPLAHEDDPEQAIRAGLQIITLSQTIAAELQQKWGIANFQVRVGINTGLVALGGLTEAEDTLMGAAVNLAARLESAAPPGGLLISHDTYRHVRGVFDVESLESIRVKGFDEAVRVYHVQRVRPRAFRLYTRGVEGIETRMVGRETELKYLQDALLTAIEEGEGQMVTITGEAGVGKSRLLYEFQDWIELLPPPAVRFFEGRARQEAQRLPYGLLRDLFAFRFQIQDDDSAQIARQKISTGFEEVLGGDREGEMRAHFLGHWLGYDFSDSPHLKGVLTDAEQLRNRCLMYLVEYFKALSGHAPVVIFLEDIHWADDSSLDAVNWMEERLRHQRLLVVCAARPTLFERRPYWGEGLSYHRRLELEPLSRRESRQLVAEILKLVPEVPSDLRELVVEGAEGNPFYVEELIKMLVEEGVIVKEEESWHIEPSRLSEIQVPPTLAGVLQARLDSLPQRERTVLQQASVVGRLFWDRIITYIQSTEDDGTDVVPEALTALRSRELIYRREESAFAEAREYIFKHDILREVTYESVIKRLRRVYHGLVADWLIAQGIDRVGEYLGLIGEHLLLAGRDEQASQYFIQAGEVALASYANREAEAHFKKALNLELDQLQRAVCLSGLGISLGRQGRAEEADQYSHQAIDLYHELGDDNIAALLYTRLSQVLWYVDYQKAWDVCKEGLALLSTAVESPGLASLLAEAGRTAYFRVQSEEKVISLCTQAIAMAERVGNVEARADASITLALVKGDLQQGIKILQEAAALSEAHQLLYIAARAHFNLGYSYSKSMGDINQAYRHYMRSAEIARRAGHNDGIIMALLNAFEAGCNGGYLQSVQDIMTEFLDRSNVTEAHVNRCLKFSMRLAMHYRGEWLGALRFDRAKLQQLHEGGSIQFIAEGNVSLVDVILDLHRFADEDQLAEVDLEEAQAALLENIEMQWIPKESQLLLAVIYARKGMIQEAYDKLDIIDQAADEPLNKLEETFRLQAEFEIAFAERHWDEAVFSCQSLIDIYHAAERRWEWARQLINLGDALVGRNESGDREKADKAFHQALEMFTEMDAPGYVRVLEERLVML